MAATSYDNIVDGILNHSQVIPFVKNLTNNYIPQAQGWTWQWFNDGAPGQNSEGIAAGAPFYPSQNNRAFLPITAPASGKKLFVGRFYAVDPHGPQELMLVDHLAICNTNLTTSATVHNLTVATPALATRIGEPDYSELQWWIGAWLTGTSTATTATLSCTLYDIATGTTSTANVTYALSTGAAGMQFRCWQLIPPQGKTIVSIISSAGSVALNSTMMLFCTRTIASLALYVSNMGESATWGEMGMPEVDNDACLAFIHANGVSQNHFLQGELMLFEA